MESYVVLYLRRNECTIILNRVDFFSFLKEKVIRSLITDKKFVCLFYPVRKQYAKDYGTLNADISASKTASEYATLFNAQRFINRSLYF